MHSDVLSSRAAINRNGADALVKWVINAIIARRAFPDWASLVMGSNEL